MSLRYLYSKYVQILRQMSAEVAAAAAAARSGTLVDKLSLSLRARAQTAPRAPPTRSLIIQIHLCAPAAATAASDATRTDWPRGRALVASLARSLVRSISPIIISSTCARRSFARRASARRSSTRASANFVVVVARRLRRLRCGKISAQTTTLRRDGPISAAAASLRRRRRRRHN